MQEYIPMVKETSLYREIAKNLLNSLELPREAISNSIDAECKNINIEVCRNSKGIFCIKIEDDGCDMDNSENVFNFETLKDYILWFATGGSFKSLFEHSNN
ncbi:hypothetical protein DVW07_05230 [Clostridium botulinum]|uniref:ATP-binding protein n=1 Tax=Clostridium botulinum TaxID=1491 RepID=UPI00196749FF|nr:ATP-binding protein [Clostridium botulinum]MBN1041465.1 hypothetical protein [Clostridium botulinum]